MRNCSVPERKYCTSSKSLAGRCVETRSEIGRSLTQFEAQNLARSGLGQLRNKLQAAWPLVIGKSRNDKFLESGGHLCIANKSGLEDDPRDRLEKAILVFIRHDSDFRNGRMLN